MSLDTSNNNGYSRMSFRWDYVFDYSGFIAFADALLNGTIANYGINNLFTSWSDYVVKAQVFPFSLDNFFGATSTSQMYFGKSTISFNGYYLTMNHRSSLNNNH